MPAGRRAKTEDREPDDDLMRRLVAAVEKYTTQVEADRAAKEADRQREANAVGAVFWALFGLTWLASVQRAAVAYLVTSNWGILPVLIPLFGIVAAFAYRAFRLKVFKVSLVYAVVGIVVLNEVVLMLIPDTVLVRAVNVLLAYIGLYYFLSAGNLMTDDEANGQAINDFVRRRPRFAGLVLVLVAIASIAYMFAPTSGSNLAPTVGVLLGMTALVLIRAEWPRLRGLVAKLRRA